MATATATELLARLEAAKALLDSLCGSSCLGAASASQRDAFVDILSTARLTPAECAEVALSAQAVAWAAGDLQRVVEAIFLPRRPSGAHPPARRGLQDFGSMTAFFKEEHWEVLLANNGGTALKLSTIVDHLVALGLRSPTESTMQLLTGLYLICAEGPSQVRIMGHTQKLSMLRFCKRSLRQAGRHQPLVWLPALPQAPETLAKQQPTLYRAVFGDAPPVPCRISEVALREVCSSIAMRSSRHAPPEQECSQVAAMSAQMMQMTQMAQSFMQLMQNGFAPGMQQGFALGPRVSAPLRLELPPPLAPAPPVAPASAQVLPPLPMEPVPAPAEDLPIVEEPVAPPPLQKQARRSLADSVALISSALADRNAAKSKGQRRSEGVAEKSVCAEGKEDSKGKCKNKHKRGEGKGKNKDKGRKTQGEHQKEEGKRKPEEGKSGKGKDKSKKSRDGAWRPHFGVERTREQIICRTGLRGPGSTFRIPFPPGGEAEAVKQAKLWVKKQERK